MESTAPPESIHDRDRDERFRLRSEYVISEYLRDHQDSRLHELVKDRSLSLDDAHEIMHEANVDEKTGLPNAKFLRYILNQEMAWSREDGQPISILVLDIDDFRKINREIGHTGADIILRDVAQTIQDSVRNSDAVSPYTQDQTVSRWGGEEFVVILPAADDIQARLVAERIRGKIADKFTQCRPSGQGLTVTIGVAEYDKHKHGDAKADESTPADQLKSWQRFITDADQAMVSGKAKRKNRVYPELTAVGPT